MTDQERGPRDRARADRFDGALKVAAFAGLLAGVFAVAALAGGAIDPSGSDANEPSGASGHGDAMSGDDHGAVAEAPSASPPGLQVAEGDYRLLTDPVSLATTDPKAPFEFQVVDRDGSPVVDFDVEHERSMHFIVVRRDLTGFQHLHPEMRSDGTWSTPVDFSRAGAYRVFADFAHDGVKHTLGADVNVGGSYRPEPLPAAHRVAETEGGLEVTLEDHHGSGRVEFGVSRNGDPVDDELEPYLGAKGHLVTLRAGDLAYLHSHPDGDELAFDVDFPSDGTYRLFVQFRYRGEVHTAAFTQEVSR